MARRTKPPVAEWIARERKRAGLSVDQLVERLSLVGVVVTRQTIQVWESYANRTPKADTLDALERVFGSTAPSKEPATPEGMAGLGSLVEAVNAQTEALVNAIRDRDSALARRDAEIEALLRELAGYRLEAKKARIVEQSLIEALPEAIASALAAALGATPSDDPASGPRGQLPPPVRA